MNDNVKHCLLEALQNISGKTVPDDVICKCHTTCDMLNAFNDLYKCSVTISGLLNSTNVSSEMTVTVKDSSGSVVSPAATNKYLLTAGDYTYNATVSGAVAKENVAFTVSAADVQGGTKNVIIQFTAA